MPQGREPEPEISDPWTPSVEQACYQVIAVDSTAPAVFLAAGAGLAPVRALLESALARRRRTALTLVFSARGEGDVFDHERFADWQRREPRFRFVRTLTREAGRPPHGRIPATLASLVGGLEGHGTAPAHLHTEAFQDESPPGRPMATSARRSSRAVPSAPARSATRSSAC